MFSVSHRTPGNLRGFVQAKMRNLKSGTMTENRFSSEDKVEKAMHERKEGTLKSGRSGKTVKSLKQAIAIGISEARREGKKAPKK